MRRSYTAYCSSTPPPPSCGVRFTVIHTSGASVSHTSAVWRISSAATRCATSQEGAPQPRTRNQARASVCASNSASEISTTSAMEQRRRPSRARKEDSHQQRGSHFGAPAKSQTA